jgi:tripartite-type tricarboxylate transporter receptor subunit TctC
MADVRSRLDALGLEPQPGTSAEFAAYVKAEVAKWAKIVKTAGVTAD